MKRFPEIDKIIKDYQLEEIEAEIYENIVERIAIEITERQSSIIIGIRRLLWH